MDNPLPPILTTMMTLQPLTKDRQEYRNMLKQMSENEFEAYLDENLHEVIAEMIASGEIVIDDDRDIFSDDELYT